MGLGDRLAAWRDRPRKRPRGGAPGKTLYVPADPTAAPGEPPVSPGEALEAVGIAPPRPLVWVGTASSGATVWSAPVANGAGLDLWRDLRGGAEKARVWPVLTGAVPVPGEWHLAAAQHAPPAQPPDERGRALLAGAWEAGEVPVEGLRTRLEPATEGVVEPALVAGYLALVTGVAGWQVPQAVGFDGVGGWSAAEHSAVLGSWQVRFGAELVALTSDTVGLLVTRPPRTHEDAFAVAQELYAYCPDVVTHGLRSLWGVATTLAVSPAWVLRWSS